MLIATAYLPPLPPLAAAPISGPPMALQTMPMAQPVPVPFGAFQHGSGGDSCVDSEPSSGNDALFSTGASRDTASTAAARARRRRWLRVLERSNIVADVDATCKLQLPRRVRVRPYGCRLVWLWQRRRAQRDSSTDEYDRVEYMSPYSNEIYSWCTSVNRL